MITQHWFDDDKTILLQTFSGEVTLPEYTKFVDEAADILAGCDYDVHLIADFRDVPIQLLPKNILAGFNYAERKLPPNQGFVVFVKPNMLIGVYIKIATSLGFNSVSKLFVADTIEEAEQLIKEKIAEQVDVTET